MRPSEGSDRLATKRAGKYPGRHAKPNPFRYFKTSLEIIRLAVMMYVRFSSAPRETRLSGQNGDSSCQGKA